MSENQTVEAGQAEGAEGQEEEAKYEYPITVEDIGPGAKRVSIEIPRERIEEKLTSQFRELRQQAAIPGFRSGHAPQKLIEKRFGSDVKDQVRRALIGESYEQAVEKHSLQVLGEPEFDNPDSIQIPDQGPLKYTFQVEVQPEINLPDLSSLTIERPRISIKEENIDQAMQNLREQQGALVPVEDRGLETGDYLIGDVHVKVDGNIVAHQHDAQLVSRPARLVGIQIDDLDKQLAGLKPGEKRSINATAPDDFPNEQLRGKQLEIEIALKDIKRLELAEITPAFLADLGFKSEQELRNALREQMIEKVDYDVQQAMREQINRYLLNNVELKLPGKMSERQALRVINRRAVDLMMRGVPREQVEANLDRIRSGASEEAARELKLYFILQKIATDKEVDVSEAELNGRIASLAVQRGQRPEKLKQQMTKDGSLGHLFLQLREQKALDKILETAQIKDVEYVPDEPGKSADAPEPATAEASNEPTATTPPPAATEPSAPAEPPKSE